MKKIYKLLLVITIISILILSGCGCANISAFIGEKHELTAEQLAEIMQQNGLNLLNPTDNPNEYELLISREPRVVGDSIEIKNRHYTSPNEEKEYFIISKGTDGNYDTRDYQLHYIDFIDIESASNYYDTRLSHLQTHTKETLSSEKSETYNLFRGKTSFTNNNYYTILIQLNDTVIEASSPFEQQQELDNLIKQLSYMQGDYKNIDVPNNSTSSTTNQTK